MKFDSLKERLDQFLQKRNIAQQIALGYGTTIGIAVLGALSGLVIGSVYESRVAQYRDLAVQKAQLASRLESDTFLLALHPQHLLESADKSSWLEDEIKDFDRDIAALRLSSRTFENFLTINSHLQKAESGRAAAQSLRFFLDDYELWVESLWLALRSSSQEGELGPYTIQLREARVAIFAAALSQPEGEKLQIQLKKLSEELQSLGASAKELELQALGQLQGARNLRFWVVILSLVTSTGLAIACAVQISQAIAKPIRTLTHQTHRITQEENFDLQVSVESGGEMSRLASSIDQLVRWAAQYTQELQLAQATLEQRVEDRTQELRIAQANLVQSEKMSSLGQMVAGVAHEINNPVGFIYSNLPYAARYVADLLELVSLYQSEYDETPLIEAKIEEIELPFLQDDVVKVLDAMKLGADRIKKIVLSLRTFSRVDESDFTVVDLQDGLDSTVTILSHRLKSVSDRPSINIVRNYNDIPLVNCYAGPMNQVFMNLIANAIDALEEHFTKTLKDERDISTLPRPQITLTTCRDGDHCLIVIGDNGPGIPEAVCDRIFDPFFTTKAVGQGTGMGLSISHQIVTERHGGTLTCDSCPHRGTQFIIRLPIIANPREDDNGQKS